MLPAGGRESAGMDQVSDYVELVQSPWGRIFYDLLFSQLGIPRFPRMKILDFGSGLGVTSDYFAAWHDIVAIEPNKEMIESSFKDNPYTQICGGIEKVNGFEDNTFDFIFCHNVFEYIEDKEPIFAELLRVLKQCGTFSLVKHNRSGKVFHSAVFWSDPKKALELVDEHANDRSNYFGTQYIYSNSDVMEWADHCGATIRSMLGMRAFWSLGQDSSVKFTNDWYENMLKLENRAAGMDEYRQVAFYNHILIEKTGSGQ